jgi:MYXO-CTERM domain-containing protein
VSVPSPVARLALASAALSGAVAWSAAAHAQTHPFPTNGHYAQGFVPPSATAAATLESYRSWKAHYLKNDCGGGYWRVDNATGNASTFSEGQGYGMVLTAYFGDRAEFDGLWAFAKKSFNDKGLMGWHETCSGFIKSDGGGSSATDGDEDIGFALIVAAAQWGGTYLTDAKAYLTTLKSVDFVTCAPSGRTVPTAGSWMTTEACTTSGGGSNTSYWTPAYYRVFADFTLDEFWAKTADDVVTLYGLAANPTTGILVNEVDPQGAPVGGQTYDYNSCRIPWRAALDYLWYGTPGAKAELTRLTAWASSVGIDKVVDGYKADGTPSDAGKWKGMNAFVGGFAVGAMASDAATADAFTKSFLAIANDNGTYYGASLRTLYLLTLSGNEWNPVEALGAPGAGARPVMATATLGGAGDAGPPGASAKAVPGSDAVQSAAGTPSVAGDGGAGGCGCRAAGSPPRTPIALGAFLLAGAGRLRRRRTRGE